MKKFKNIKQRIFILLILLTFTQVYGQKRILNSSHTSTTYYTIGSGAWDNSDIWSLDGTSHCYCVPSTTIDGFNVMVNDYVEQTSNISILSNDSLYVGVNGQLFSEAYNIEVDSGGFMYNEGQFTINKMTVKKSGLLYNSGFIRINAGTIDLTGTIAIENGELHVDNGNIQIYPDAILFVEGSIIRYEAGNLQVEGELFMNESCVFFETGNARNYESGKIIGNGAIETSGNIRNDGEWDPDITWCASGNSSGLPTQPDCSGNTSCEKFLPIELSFFRGKQTDHNTILLEWETLNEQNNEYFTIHNSSDGINFTQVVNIPGSLTSMVSNKYEYEILYPREGINYFKLSQTDIEGIETFFEVISVPFGSESPFNITIYPNPATEEVHVIVGVNSEAEIKITLLSLEGYLIKEIYTGKMDAQEYYLNFNVAEFNPGPYFLECIIDGKNRLTKKLIIL